MRYLDWIVKDNRTEAVLFGPASFAEADKYCRKYNRSTPLWTSRVELWGARA